ncbi:MAG: alpha-mannosidase [Phycisphaerales bacterium]|nr:alpha-mannosidase [Phycisphaerales bacterium]
MSFTQCRLFASLAMSALFVASAAEAAQPQAADDMCIAFSSENLAKGNGNWFTYYRFSDQRIAIRDGDVFTYRVYLDPGNPVAKGGVDIFFGEDRTPLRDLRLNDDKGVRVHGDGILSEAVGKWLTRRVALDKCAKLTTTAWVVVFEGDESGKYLQFVDDVTIEHADGTKTVIYGTGLPPSRSFVSATGYSQKPGCVAIPAKGVSNGADLAATRKLVEEFVTRTRLLNEARREVEFVRKFLERNPDPHLDTHVKNAINRLNAAERADATTQEIEAALHETKDALSHTHPVMEKYTGHLVGHAHIDLQWLWEWQEGIACTRDTFAQAIRFMDEFPDFTFSQSSSCLYETIEEHYPELFKKIQEKVKAGKWELVGGRVCEGDLNIISPESHARHFLYGQRYFRERFGKTATVGWEPDTFGHCAQMPQILKLGGCDFYYFCRGGKNTPLFWWEALDGTRVLTFDEPATGSWYNSGITDQQLQELLDFEKTSGSRDSLWVYGIGNHGGGPTREQIEQALAWMKTSYMPKVRFSTASEFFARLQTLDLSKIPTIRDELNPVFDGCYTSHVEVKTLNRDAEAMTTSAEAVATVAAEFGFKYPREAFRKNWEAICFNHHHDTLPGSGIHAPYERTKTTLGRVIAEDREIITRAMELLTLRVKPRDGLITVMVFNPLGWSRSGWVETYLVKSGWNHGQNLDLNKAVAVAPDGQAHPVTVIDPRSRHARFWAADIPAFGWRVFEIKNGAPTKPVISTSDDKTTIQTDQLKVTFDLVNGVITSLEHEGAKTAGAALGRLEVAWENPGGMSAWVIGKIEKTEPLKPTSTTVTNGPDFVDVTFDYELPAHNDVSAKTTARQSFRVLAGSDQIECTAETDWQAVGNEKQPNPSLKVAFAGAAEKLPFTYEVPFGHIDRPSDGREWPALKWVAGTWLQTGGEVTLPTFSLGVLNDNRHGFSAKDGTLRMTLIRPSYDPDPIPNPGRHVSRYAIVPVSSNLERLAQVASPAQNEQTAHARAAAPEFAVLSRRAAEFNQPLLSATVPFDATGEAPAEWSLLSIDNASIVPTGLKRAEDGGDIVVRMYEAAGGASQAALRPTFKSNGGKWVNFVEDALSDAVMSGNGFTAEFKKFEIKTLRLTGSGAAR